MASWRVSLQTTVPRSAVAAEPPEPGGLLPNRIEFRDSLVPHSLCGLGPIRVTLMPQPATAEYGHHQVLQVDAVVLEASDAMQAGIVAMPIVDLVLDDLSFQFQEPLPRGQVDVVEVVSGDIGARTLIAPVGLDLIARLAAEPPSFPNLRVRGGTLSVKLRRALRFYTSAFSVRGEEAFVLYWTSLEHLFAEEGADVREPVTIHGHHVVEPCPACGKSTVERRHGQSMKAYLAHLGTDEAAASSLYQLRMVVHGMSPDSTLLSQTDLLRVLLGRRLASLLSLPEGLVQPAPFAFVALEGTTLPGDPT